MKQKSLLKLLRSSKTLLEEPKAQSNLEILKRSSENNESDQARPIKKISFDIPPSKPRMNKPPSHKNITISNQLVENAHEDGKNVGEKSP